MTDIDVEWYEENIFNESVLYEALGKERARDVLRIWNEYKGHEGLSVRQAITNARSAAQDKEIEWDPTMGGDIPDEHHMRRHMIATRYRHLKELLDAAQAIAFNLEISGNMQLKEEEENDG